MPTDGPWQAREYRKLAWYGERGPATPADRLLAASQRAALVASTEAEQRAESGRLSPAGWVFRGPSNVGGRTRSLVVDPNDPSHVWAGSVGGGLWESRDDGATWAAIGNGLDNLAVGSLAIDPSNPSILYLGTGEGQFNADALDGNGIYKSTDGGQNWTLLAATAFLESVNRIAVSHANPQIVLASAAGGGIYRSADGGASWNQVYSGVASFDVEIDPNNASNAVAHLADWDSSLYHRVVRSTDAGATWQEAGAPLNHLSGFEARIELTYARSSPGWVYALAGPAGTLYRSTDGGASWTATGATVGEGQMWYGNTLWVDPTDSSRLVAGAVNLYRSSNGGASFGLIAAGYIQTTTPHPDQHCVVEDPGYDGTTNRRVWVCNDGGVFRTEDITTASTSSGWVSRNAGYHTAQYYHGSGSATNQVIAGGTQDNGTETLLGASTTAVLTWGGDGGTTVVDPLDDRYLYGHIQALGYVFRSRNFGDPWGDVISAGITETGMGNWVSPLALDPSDPNRLLVGARSLWRTTNARTGNPPTWQNIKPAGSTQLNAVAIAPTSSDVVWVADNFSNIFRTANATAAAPSWITVHDNWLVTPLPSYRFPTRIVISRFDPATVYVSFGGYVADNLWRTQDSGVTWRPVSGSGAGGLPEVPIRGIAEHPSEPEWLYVGTEIGVFASTDGGQTWGATNQGPDNVAVDQLDFLANSTTLLAATHGRGMWTIDLPADRLLVAGVPAPGQLTSSAQGGVWRFYYLDLAPGSHDLEVTLSAQSGDLDLYVRQDQKPSLGSWSCRPRQGGTADEICSIPSPGPGRWWIGVLNYDVGSLTYRVNASWLLPGQIFADGFESGDPSAWN